MADKSSTPNDAFVYIVDDDESVRRSVARLIRSAGYQVATFDSANAFLSHRPVDAPSCLILDIHMPGLTGMDLQEALTSAGLSLPIIFVTGVADVPITVQAMKRGAQDLLTKPIEAEDLLAAIRNAIEIDVRRKARQNDQNEIRTRMKALTPRETEVLQLVITGMLNKQIAAELGISEKTIKVHRARVMEKMAAGSLVDLVHMAERARKTD